MCGLPLIVPSVQGRAIKTETVARAIVREFEESLGGAAAAAAGPAVVVLESDAVERSGAAV